MRRKRFRLFTAAVAVGALLGIVLLVESGLTYRYVTNHLLRDHLNWEAGQHLSSLENRVRALHVESRQQLQALIEEICRERKDGIAWIRIADANGAVIAQSSEVPIPTISRPEVETLRRGLTHRHSVARPTVNGEVLVSTMPLRLRLTEHRTEGIASAEQDQSVFAIAEIALPTSGSNDLFRVLRNNLAISTGAALALLLSMAAAVARLPGYLRGRELEDQLDLARTVQQRLQPTPDQVLREPGFDFAAKCIPAFEVGGDYYDVFSTRLGEHTIALGDIAGKGLPASLLMAHLHGSVRSIAAVDERSDLAAGAAHLNELLCTVTSGERFASLFWGHYSSTKRELRYVNAGHLPPVIVRQSRPGVFESQRLQIGGPVLGLLPRASYVEDEVAVKGGDVLVMYSDGLAEAANRSDMEFGELRLIETVEANWLRPVEEIQKAIIEAVSAFVGRCELQDDLTVLVVRF